VSSCSRHSPYWWGRRYSGKSG